MTTNEPLEDVAQLLVLSATLVVKQLLDHVLERPLHGDEPNTMSGSDSIAILLCSCTRNWESFTIGVEHERLDMRIAQ